MYTKYIYAGCTRFLFMSLFPEDADESTPDRSLAGMYTIITITVVGMVTVVVMVIIVVVCCLRKRQLFCFQKAHAAYVHEGYYV